MATIVQKASKFVATRKTLITRTIATVLGLLFIFLVNHRRLIGYWHYDREFSKAANGIRSLGSTCVNTLKERDLWRRVTTDGEWYFVKRCQGSRDGAGQEATWSASFDFLVPYLVSCSFRL
jgi:anthranilate phosphoribosyltransferase